MDLLATGSSLAWLADLFDRTRGDLETMASLAADKDNNEIMFTPYLAGGEQGALWRTDLSATISQLRLGTTQGEIALALYEGIAFEVLRCLDAAHATSAPNAVVWLVSNDNHGLLPAIVQALCPYDVVSVPGLSPSLLGAALIALDALGETPDLTSRRGTVATAAHALEPSYVATLNIKRAKYLAAGDTSP
jgi:xylulokinase